MNVTCPDCQTVFRVDPAKVPEKGVRARCSVCGGLFPVLRPADWSPTEPPRRAPTPEAPAPAPVAPPSPPAPPRYAAPVATHPPIVELPRPEPFASPPPPPPPAPAAMTAPPSMPTHPPAFHVREPEPQAPPPVAPPPPGRGAPLQRFSNPFLQQDPSTRARRLARALISDLVVYYPEKRERGLAEGNLKELFAEEIRKSWEEYSEQVGEELAGATPYFTEALNEILAEGRPLFG